MVNNEGERKERHKQISKARGTQIYQGAQGKWVQLQSPNVFQSTLWAPWEKTPSRKNGGWAGRGVVQHQMEKGNFHCQWPIEPLTINTQIQIFRAERNVQENVTPLTP